MVCTASRSQGGLLLGAVRGVPREAYGAVHPLGRTALARRARFVASGARRGPRAVAAAVSLAPKPARTGRRSPGTGGGVCARDYRSGLAHYARLTCDPGEKSRIAAL